MSLEQSLAVVTTVADFDAVDILGLIAKWGILSMLFGMVALVFAISIAALLDDRPLKEIFKLLESRDRKDRQPAPCRCS